MHVHFQARNQLIAMGISLLIIYCPNAFYKMKWKMAKKIIGQSNLRTYLTIEGDCASIPTTHWTTQCMEVMVYVDFIVSSLLPFSIILICNIIIIKHMFGIQKKVY